MSKLHGVRAVVNVVRGPEPLGGHREAAFLRDGDEISEMRSSMLISNTLGVCGSAYKVFFPAATAGYLLVTEAIGIPPHRSLVSIA